MVAYFVYFSLAFIEFSHAQEISDARLLTSTYYESLRKGLVIEIIPFELSFGIQ